MRVDAFDFELPPELIALRPARPRDSARLLVVRTDGQIEHRGISDLPALMQKGDLLVANDSKVFPARLFGTRAARQDSSPDVKLELLLHRRLSASRYRAFARPAKRLRAGDHLSLGDSLAATVAGSESPSER